MAKYTYQTAVNPNSNVKLGKDEDDENIGEQWVMTREMFVCLLVFMTVPINLLEFPFSNLKQVKLPIKQLHTYDIKKYDQGARQDEK